MEKMTKKQMFEMIKGVCVENQIIVDFCDHEIELLARKNSSNVKTKTQIENDGIMENIVAELTRIGKPLTITDLQNESDILKDYSNQKLSALLKKLVDNGKVDKVIDKKKSYFKVI